MEDYPELSFYFCLLLKSYFMEIGKLSDWKGLSKNLLSDCLCLSRNLFQTYF